jgi:hypothetical protein
MNSKYILLLLTIVLLSYSCKSKKKEQEAEKIVTEWIGKEIRFPKDIGFSIMGKDTSCANLLQKPFKILLYIDSTGCTGCRLKFYDWKSLKEEADSIAPKSISFIFIFQPKNEKELQFILRKNQLNEPVIIDPTDKINKQNHFPKKRPYQCFLLDKNNKVVMVGNPFLNPKIWKLYKTQITGLSNRKDPPSTTIQLNTNKLSFGHIRIGHKSKLSIMLKNTGKNPLIIYSVQTSCGCIHINFEKKPIASKNKTIITALIEPKNKGFFQKTLDVHMNTKDSPLQLILNGIVE